MPPKNPTKRVKIEPGFGGKTLKIIGLRAGGQWRFVLQLIIPDFYAVRNEIIAIQSDAVTADDLELPQNRGQWYLTVSTPQAVDNPGISVGLARSSSTVGTFNVVIKSRVVFGSLLIVKTSPNGHKSSAKEVATTNWQHTVLFSDLFKADFVAQRTNNSLSIQVAVTLTASSTPAVSPRRTLADDFADLFRQSSPAQAADLSLLSAGGKKFPAHRLVLVSRSAVFAEKTGKPQSKNYQFKDIGDFALACLLEFLYTDTISLTDESSWVYEELLKAAVNYGIPALKDWMADFMLTEITFCTVTSLFNLADTYQLINLKSTCSEFAKFTVSLTNELAYLRMAKELGDTRLETQCLDVMKAKINVDNMWDYWNDSDSDWGRPLKSFYLDFMQANITVKNVGQILMIAEEEEATALKVAAMAFLRDGHAQEFSVSAGFDQFRSECSFGSDD